MVPVSPPEALGSHARDVRDLVVGAVRSLHERFAEAHEISDSRYGMGFGSQWRDLLDDVSEVHAARGYRTHKVLPGGYKLPVVNDCLVYAWRSPEASGTVSSFASSPTRMNGFATPLLDATLFEPTPKDSPAGVVKSPEVTELEDTVRAAEGVMPLVLVIIQSSPKQLQSIDWAVAELDGDTGKVVLHGRENIWGPELAVGEITSDVEPFDSGTPNGPTIEPQEQQGTNPDA